MGNHKRFAGRWNSVSFTFGSKGSIRAAQLIEF